MMILCRICEMVGLPAYSLTWYVVFRATIRYVSAILAGFMVLIVCVIVSYLFICAIIDAIKYIKGE